MKSEKGLELTNEEKETYEKVINFIRKEENYLAIYAFMCNLVSSSTTMIEDED